MNKIRTVKKLFKANPTLEGAGVRLKRVFGNSHVPMLDPFLLLDDFSSDDPDDFLPGFPWHPHRGIETITYVIEGNVEHGDSMKNKGVIRSGDVQWMTAGSGIIHQEMPKGNKKGSLWGFQLWANLPKSHKMMDPRYRGLTKDQIPEIKLDNGVKIKIICGKVNGTEGPVKDIITDPAYLDVSVPKNTSFSHEIKAGHTAFAYVISGSAKFDDCKDAFEYELEGGNYSYLRQDCIIKPGNMVLFNDGDRIVVKTADKDVRFLLISGKPIKEPISWYGPIVMNTKEEIKTAFEEYENGRFIKSSSK